jgi:hypothetical protein
MTGKAYIGYTSLTMEERWRQHVYNSRSYLKDNRRKFWNALRKYGEEQYWLHEVLTVCDVEQNAKDLEMKFIAEQHTYHKGYNSTLGGQGAMVGRRHSARAIEKMRQAKERVSKKTRQKISESKKHLTEQSREKIRLGQIGKKVSLTAKLKNSFSSRKRYIAIHVDGRKFEVNGLKNWAEEMRLNLRSLRVTLDTQKPIRIGVSRGWMVQYAK